MLKFNEGITCIIGPNGSGKSNIVDAVRWVLGEQRTAALRSDKMENVIFNGTKTRKPMGMVEVSMHIQNDKNILKSEFNEVVIARRLYRSGESQYLINNTPVRLKDVLDVFMDTGLGANSYSVIELKMVESILSENKAERRLLLEEAAGVVKYKIRRKSALRKLDATRTDLVRINDIISEVQKTVNSLSRQVGKARRYLNYTDEIKKLDVDLGRFKYHQLLDAIRPLQAQLEETSKVKEKSHHQITIDEALLEDYKRELIEKEQELQETGRQLKAIDERIAGMNQDEAVGKTKSEEMTKVKNRSLEEIENFEKKILLIQEQQQEHEQELEELREQKQHLDEQYVRTDSTRKDEYQSLQKEQEEIEQLNTVFRRQLTLLSEKKEALKQNIYAASFQKEQLVHLQEKIKENRQSAQGLQKELDQLLKAGAATAKEQTLLAEKAEKARLQLDRKNQEIASLEQLINTKLTEQEKILSRIQFFQQMIARYEGHSEGTRYIMSEREKVSGIHGPLAELISVDEKYAAALEVVLGEAVDYIVVDSLNTAKKMIDMVRAGDKGRITLIPLDRLQKMDVSPSSAAEQTAGALTEHIKCLPEFTKVVQLLLGDVFFVETLEQAIALSGKYNGYRFVTPRGELINSGRSISGGSANKRKISILGRKDHVQQLQEQEAALQKEIASLKTKLNGLVSEAEKIKHSLNAFQQESETLQGRLLENSQKKHQLRFEIEKNEQELTDSHGRLESLNRAIKELQQKTERLQQEVEGEQEELNKLEAETISKTNAYEEKNSAMQILLEEVQQKQIAVSNLQNRIDNRSGDIQRAASAISDLRENIQKRRSEIEQIEENLVKIKKQSEERRVTLSRIWQERDELDTGREKSEQYFQELKDKIITIEEQTKKFRRQHDSSLEKGRNLELQINEHRFKAENIREYILKEYSEDVETGHPYEDFNAPEAEEKIELLRMRIRNLGPVNPLAVTEYDSEKERLDFLTQQRDDLLKAEASLMETIDKINKTARSQFLETFNEIKTNFEKVFQTFFENGEGTLALEEHVDPLEADIEINVRTKGKKLQTLTLLSGGEKTLTAISLLFSIYLVKPSPFCILDEVDAPLDDVNIGRFNEALKSFSNNTQFIVVTHNKRTMEAARSLYGVTMEEEGVSKLVSVQFT